jgi:hypothetical protein
MKLAIWGTSAFGQNAVVSDDNRPTAFCNSEIAERLKILFAGDEGRGAVLPDWPCKAITGDDQVAALVQFSHYVHR